MGKVRMRLVSVRMSEEEYGRLRLMCEQQGCRSVSSFVRSAMAWMVANCDRSLLGVLGVLDTHITGPQSRVDDIDRLVDRVTELDREVERLRALVS
jgi:hypothetical protein